MKIEFLVDLAVKNVRMRLGVTTSDMMYIVHSFPVLYTDFKPPRIGRGINWRIKAIVQNIEGFDLHTHPSGDIGNKNDREPP